MKDLSVIEYFYHYEKQHPTKTFLRQPFGERWEEYTWAEAGVMARKLASYFNSLGLKPKSHIGLISKNCREWIISDLAIMMAGHISVPFFPTLTDEQIAEVLDIGDVDMLIVGKIETWDGMKAGIPEGMPVVKFPHYEANSKITRGKDWDEIMKEQEPITTDHVPQMEDLWTIIFTSGTTGTPKGVMHTYKIINSLINEAFARKNPLSIDKNGNNKMFSFLPLNHIAERAIVELMCLRYSGSISFTESIERFAANAQSVQPTLFFAVPRIYNKFRAAVLEKLPQKKLNTLLKIPIVKNIIKKKIATNLGLSNCRSITVGAAPMAQSAKDWFASLGLGLTEGYGQTENCAATSFLFAHEDKPGSVGLPHDGCTVKIHPDTNEILVKSNYVMKGYYKDPEKTAETIQDGWLHTGDQGRMDEDGYVYITGRVKDTFKTEKGEFIVPAEIEDQFGSCSEIEQMCILGLGLEQPVLMVSLSEAAEKQDAATVDKALETALTQANTNLAGYKRVSTVIVTEEPFSIESNTLTPTMKVKRPQIHNRYKDRLHQWQDDPKKVIRAK